MNIAIVGAGFSGLAVAWHLMTQKPSPNLKLTLFDSRAIGEGTSGISAGLLHPFAGAHAKLNWNGFEGMAATKELLKVSSRALGQAVTSARSGILRLALSDQQKDDYVLCAQKYSHDVQWLDASQTQVLVPGCAQAPGLLIKNGEVVYSKLYLRGLLKACEALGVNFKCHKISSLNELKDYDFCIITAGAETRELLELTQPKLKVVKGQVLELSWPSDCKPLSHPINSHVYILMTEKGNSCLVGATYEKEFSSVATDLEFAKKELLPRAFDLFPGLSRSTVLRGAAGLRAVAPKHLPLIEKLSNREWLLTGMGSKGLLYHALFAKELVKLFQLTY